ncbi:histidine phosphotransferase family protein [Rhodobacteraceae bacterium KMM 6894]|nr:histidine phosphotransferase family protein [Rhodobacteraceae bacterium KMM 6894]
MSQPNPTLAALIGSRICHDMISPVGAIANGLELLTLTGVPDGPEMALVTESAAHASARIRYFRVAFGLASATQSMSSGEITGILNGVYTGNVRVDWQITDDLPRPVAQAAILGLMCAEQAVPHGGTLTVAGTPDALVILAAGQRLTPNPAHWAVLNAPAGAANVPAAQVQFALLPVLLNELGRVVHVTQDDSAVTLTF